MVLDPDLPPVRVSLLGQASLEGTTILAVMALDLHRAASQVEPGRTMARRILHPLQVMRAAGEAAQVPVGEPVQKGLVLVDPGETISWFFRIE
jgi:hypothetical protein